MVVGNHEFRSNNLRQRPLQGQMKRWAMFLMLGSTLAAAMMTILARAQGDRSDPHGQKDACPACHLGAPPDGAQPPGSAGSAAAGRKYPLRLSTERAVCERCHNVGKSQTHPVEMKPTLLIPTGWPLNARGQLTCGTCHDPHQAVLASAKPGQRLLRGDKSGLPFCQQCHDIVSGENSRAWHVAAMQVAHLSPKPSPGAPAADGGIAAADPATGSGKLDALSARCMTCHDGTSGPSAKVTVGRRSLNAGSPSSHPIGVLYPAFSPPGKPGQGVNKLRRKALLDERIRLFDDKVGCVSCHDLYASTDKNYLVLPTERGKLCLSCHDM